MTTLFRQDGHAPVATLACDSHVHLFLPEAFPYAADRSYTPPAATVPELLTLQRKLGMSRVVLVQPSCYGTDNGALVAGLEELGSMQARGVAVVDVEKATDLELQLLQRQGVRGLRLNLSVKKDPDHAQLHRQLRLTQERCAPLGWHLQINAAAATLHALASQLEALTIPIVFDHFAGGAAAADITTHLLRAGKAWVKLSAPYRASREPGYGDLDGLVARFAEANPHQLVWASDWPHTGGTGVRQASATDIEPFRKEDAVSSLLLLERWIPNAALREDILVRNPAALYDF